MKIRIRMDRAAQISAGMEPTEALMVVVVPVEELSEAERAEAALHTYAAQALPMADVYLDRHDGPPPDGAPTHISADIEAVRRQLTWLHTTRAREAARQAAAVVDAQARRAAARAADIAKIRRDNLCQVGGEWRLTPLAATYRCDSDVAEILAAAMAEADRRNRIERDERTERRRVERVEQETWIREHGSPRLQRCLAEGIECDAIYREERLAAERPGWRWSDEVVGGYDEPRNPPVAALDYLDSCRQIAPDASLIEWREETVDDDSGAPASSSSYRCIARLLGREIVSEAVCSSVLDDDESPV